MPDTLDQTARVIEAMVARLQDPDLWWQVGAVALLAGAAWLAARALSRFFESREAGSGAASRVAVSLAHGTLFLALFGLGSFAAAGVLARLGLPFDFARTIALLALALAAVRLLVGVLKRVLRPGPLLVASEQLIVWTVWILVALYLLGWAGPIAAALDSVQLPIGEEGFSLLEVLKAALTLSVFMLAGAWLSSVASRRLMSSTQLSIGLRVGLAKFLRLFLVVVAGLIGLSAVGFNLAALAVFSGAPGIGLGFGLQRIAANFVSGFILVGDRSIRQGDVITIGDRFGVVKELRARYMVVRDRDGVDTLIPNENVISAEVVNWSYSDRAVRLKLPVQISYKDNPRTALALLLKAAEKHPRVLREPAPASRVIKFDDNGIALELRFWIQDPEDGVNNVRSDLHLAIWDLFEEAGITIPYPQRDLHLPDGWPGAAGRATAPRRLD
jgi:small-conductance mechanosensitive channel